MAGEREVTDLRDAIGRGLSARLTVERETPEQLIALLRRLHDKERASRRDIDRKPRIDNAERGLDSVERAIATAQPSSAASRKTVRRELNLYLDAIGKYLPARFCRMVIWLRRPSRLPARILISLLLVVCGLLSFLPVLGLWMLPLGLIILSQDLPMLQRPLLSAFQWADRRSKAWRRPAASIKG
jgi:hypothetical protein